MPRRGGSAAKYGLRYEDRWTAYCTIRILGGEASAIYIEEPGAEREGFEFSLTTPTGIEHHQVKRQKTGEDRWTLKALAEAGVLGNFQTKLQDPTTRCTFASGNAAGSLEELIDRASKFGDYGPFRRDLQDNLTWKRQFEDLCEIWDDPGGEWTFAALGRVEVSTINELELRRALQLAVELHLDGPPKPAPAALIEVIREAVNERLEAPNLWQRLEDLGYKPASRTPEALWADIALLNERFISSRTATLIGGDLIPRAETDRLVEGLADNRLAFLQGNAGTGKSDVILELCQRLADEGRPFLALRLDRPARNYGEGAAGLGEAFGLATSPAAALSAATGSGEGTLIIDQLDALSTTSGRRPEFLDGVEETVSVALADPKIRVVLACRTFDAENDARLREIARLAGEEDRFTINVGLLSSQTVEETLKGLDIAWDRLSGSLKELLRLPLHLWLVQSVAERDPEHVRNLHSSHDLYHHFWEEKRVEVDEISGRESGWLAVIERLVDAMSDNQRLTAPKALVDGSIDTVKAMLSAGVLVEDGENIAFFHETFFDYAYARSFVGRERTLPELLCDDQFLFRRAQVRQILQFSRRSGGLTYRKDLDFLLNSEKVRFHLKDLVIAWLGSLGDPDRVDWGAVAPIIHDPGHELHEQTWRALCSAPWFRLLDGEGLLEQWLEDEEVVERAAFILIAAAESEASRVAALLSRHLGDSGAWDRRIAGIVTRVDVEAGRPLFELLLAMVERGTIEGADFWFSVHGLPGAEPEWACELLAAYLRERIEASTGEGETNPFRSAIPGNLHLQEYVVEAATGAPKAFVEAIWPLFLSLATENGKRRHDDEEMYSDRIWMLRHFSDFAAGLDDQLLIGMEVALARLAVEEPEDFEILLKDQWKTRQETIAYLLFQGIAGNPARFADLTIDFILTDKARFRVGHSDGSHWGTRRVLQAVTPHCSERSLERLQQAILGYATSWERSKEGHAGRGLAEFTLLGAVPEERLSEAGGVRLAELQRKFEREDADPPTGIISGVVGSPIGEEDARKMSDENWLQAMRRYATDDFTDRPELLIGGADQLAGVLERLTKEDPLRFALLATEQMDDGLNVAYFEAVLRGVGQAEGAVPMEAAAGLVERCNDLPGHPCGRWIADAVVRLSDEAIPDRILKVVAWYAENGEGASTISFDGEEEATGERLLMRGLNSVRGGTAHDIARLVAGHPSHLQPLLPAIRSLVNDPDLGVRAMAAEIPLAVLRHDEDLARELFLEVVASDQQEILACRGVGEYLRYRGATDLEHLQPVLERMLESDDEETRRLGAVQAALAALGDEQARPLVEHCLEGGAEFRVGVSQVFAHNVTKARFRSYCEENLRRLFDDPEPEVRKSAAGAIREMRNGGLEKLTDLIVHFIGSQALRDDPEALMLAVEGATAPPPQLTLRGARAVLDVLEEPADVRRREAMIASEIVSMVLRAYVDAGDVATKNEALDLFDAALRSNAYGARRALEDFDRA